MIPPGDNYYKLVRDGIPARMRERGIETDHLPLLLDAFVIELSNKLIEESDEVHHSLFAADKRITLEELADLQFALDTLVYTLGFNSLQLAAAVNAKLRTHGGFSNRTFLRTSWPISSDGGQS